MLQKTLVAAVALLVAMGCLTTIAQAQTIQPQVAIVNMAGIEGTFTFSPLSDTQASASGASVVINIKQGLTSQLALLPAVGFEYHIHVKQVGAENNCDATGGHLDDPAHPGVVPCDPKTPEKCQEGDLSGKHGNLMGTSTGELQLQYRDRQLKFTGEITGIIGRSIVIHNNGARIACANILPASEQQLANGLTHTQGLNQQEEESSSEGGSASSLGISGVSIRSYGNGNRVRSNNGHHSEGRFVSSEVIWTVIGSAACGIIAALMAF